MNRTIVVAAAGVFLLAVAVAAVILVRSRVVVPAPNPPGRAASGVEPIPEIVKARRERPPVIFIGLDGADWQLLDDYIARGVMPNLARLVAEGTRGTLETLHPPLSPLIWTTMMTGVDPLRHRILDFVRVEPASGRKEPITSDERHTPAIWNMATWGDRSVASLGIWGTYPAEPVNGLMVSDRLFTFLFREEDPPEGVVFPREQEGWARSVVRRAEQSVGFGELKEYLPWLTEAEYTTAAAAADPYAHPTSALRRILVETRVYDRLASEWISRQRTDLMLLYLQGTDSIGHTFAPYAPPRQPAIHEDDYRRYSGVPQAYFAYIDRLLGEYRRAAEVRGAALMIASDHGFTWTVGRPSELSSFAHATAAKWHRDEGIYLLWGPDIPRRNGRAEKGRVAQVLPTLLALVGLPPARDAEPAPLDGAPAFDAPPVDYAAYYQPARPAATSTATRDVDEDTLARLRALGYIGAAESSASRGRRLQTTRSAGSYNNEALLLKARGRTADAMTAFENALIVDPNLASALWNLSDLLFAQQSDLDRSDMLLIRAFGSGLPEGTKFLIGRAIGYQRSGQIDRSVKLLQAAARVRPEEPEVWLFTGRYRTEKGDCSGAVSDFEKAVRLAPRNAAAFASLGLARLCVGDRAAARRDLLRSLELDPKQPRVREYLKQLDHAPGIEPEPSREGRD